MLGGREWFKRPVTCVMGFDGSVAGLAPGAPVSFRGVEIGKVARIELKPGAVIAVVAHIDASQVRGLPVSITPAQTERLIQEAVQNGLRAQLQLQSLITGQLYVGLDFYPRTPATFRGIDTGHCEIPTVPTAIAELHEQVKTILGQLAEVPLRDVVEGATRTLAAIEKLASEPEIRRVLTNLDGATNEGRVLIATLNASVATAVTSLQRATAQAERTIDEVGRDVRQLVQHVDARIDPLAAEVGGTAESARVLMEDARRTLHELDARLGPAIAAFRDAADATRDAMREVKSTTGQVNDVIDGNAPLGYQLTDVLEQLTRSARALREVTEEIQRQPNVLVLGRGKAKEQ